jgi:hypothetical protein
VLINWSRLKVRKVYKIFVYFNWIVITTIVLTPPCDVALTAWRLMQMLHDDDADDDDDDDDDGRLASFLFSA